MHPSTRRERRSTLPRLLKQAAVVALAGALMFAGVAPAAAAPADDLAALIAHAETLAGSGDYTAVTHSNLISSTEHAKNVLRDSPTDDAAVGAARSQLNHFIGQLVDLSQLRSAYASATKYGHFTAHSWSVHEVALVRARGALDDLANPSNHAWQWQVDQYAIELNASQAALVDLSALRAVYDTATRTSGDYTAASWAAFESQLIQTADFLTDATTSANVISRTTVDAVRDALIAGENALVDLMWLRGEFDFAQDFDSDGYLIYGWTIFEAARTEAETVLANTAATSAEVADATRELREARQALKFNGGLHDTIADGALFDESLYGRASWDRFSDALDVLEVLAARDLAGEAVPESEVFAALNVYHTARYGLLEMAPLWAAATDFASLTPAHYAPVTFGELAAIEAEIDRMMTDSTDPAKVDTNGDGNWVPRYWAKRAQIVDIQALITVLLRVDGLDKSGYSAHSVAALDDHRNAVVDLLVNHSLTEGDVAGFVASLQGHESSLVSIGALIDAVAAAKALKASDYTTTQWAVVTAGVTAAEALLTRAANPVEVVTSAEVSSANSTLAAAVATNGAPKPGTPASVNVTAGSGGVLKNGSTVQHGSSVNIALSGLLPGSTVTVHLHSDPILLGTFTAALDGTVNGTVTIPGNAPAGNHNLVLSFTNSDGTPGTHSIAVVIPLPKTGSDSPAPALLIGGLLLAVGGGLLVLRRRVAI